MSSESPYADVAHDNGIWGGRVRLDVGFDFEHAARVFLTAKQARDLGQALLNAASKAEEPW